MDDFAALQSEVQSSLVSATRSATTLSNEDLQFHRRLSSQLSSDLDRQNARLLGLASGLLQSASSTEEAVRSAPSLKDLDSVDGNWRAVVDVIDSLLERADTALDEFTGAVKRMSPGLTGTERATPPRQPRTSKIAMQLKALDMEKPQLHFEHVPTNHDVGPFKPLLTSKPHATIPLEHGLTDTAESSQHYAHPYQLEIEQYVYPTSVYTQADPIPYWSFDETSATLIDSEEAVAEMLEELKQAKEIAIDLEHHDQRSYVGIVCLMQISTRNKDWIVDTLKPWRRKLQCLNEVFADPAILKVLHGAYMDIVWLQRDLGLYLVGLFDTHYAARALGYPGGSLAYLLKRFVNVEAQKQYQMADWRIRPLPQELLDYARSDTHYLLYIYDCMRNELIQRSDLSIPDRQGDKLNNVLVKSSETALQRYEFPTYSTALGEGTGNVGWYKLLARTPALLSKEQFAIFRAVHRWRDNVAKDQDDSVHHVMPNHQIFSLSREMGTQSLVTRAAVFGMCHPTTQTVRLRVDDLVGVIAKAKEDGKSGPDMMEVLNKIDPHKASKRESRRDAAATATSSGDAVVSANSASIDPQDASVVSALRAKLSTLWGAAFPSSPTQHQKRTMSTMRGVSLGIPLPPITAEVLTDSKDIATPGHHSNDRATPSSPTSQDTATPAARGTSDNEIFILKDLKRKRQQGSGMDGVATQHDEVSLLPQDDESTREKNGAKKARKAAKREAKRARVLSNGIDGGIEDGELGRQEEPFDYENAPSILNPPQDKSPGFGKAEKGRQKQVNPYSKALLDTPKGAPRAPASKERAGRSGTWKS